MPTDVALRAELIGHVKGQPANLGVDSDHDSDVPVAAWDSGPLAGQFSGQYLQSSWKVCCHDSVSSSGSGMPL